MFKASVLSENKHKGSSQPTTEENCPGNDQYIPGNKFNITGIVGLSPNEAETRAPITPKPEEISVEDIRRNGFPKEKTTTFTNNLGIEIIEWHLKKDIKRRLKEGLKEGFHLVVEDGFIDPDTGGEIKHCMVLKVTKGKYEFFDPMGQPLPKDIGVPVENNYIQYQVQDYYTCFLHVMYFLKQRVNLGSMKKVLDSFPSNKAESLYLNEEHVCQYIQQCLR